MGLLLSASFLFFFNLGSFFCSLLKLEAEAGQKFPPTARTAPARYGYSTTTRSSSRVTLKLYFSSLPPPRRLAKGRPSGPSPSLGVLRSGHTSASGSEANSLASWRLTLPAMGRRNLVRSGLAPVSTAATRPSATTHHSYTRSCALPLATRQASVLGKPYQSLSAADDGRSRPPPPSAAGATIRSWGPRPRLACPFPFARLR